MAKSASGRACGAGDAAARARRLRFRHAGERHQSLQVDVAGHALLLGAHAAFGAAGLRERQRGGRGEARALTGFGQARALRAGAGIGLRHLGQPQALAPCIVLRGHLGRDRDAGLVPLGLRARETLAGGFLGRSIAPEKIHFPARLHGTLDGRGEAGGLLAGAPAGIALGIERRQQRGACSHLGGTCLLHTGACLGDVRGHILRPADQLGEQRVAQAVPPAGKVFDAALVRQRGLPAGRHGRFGARRGRCHRAAGQGQQCGGAEKAAWAGKEGQRHGFGVLRRAGAGGAEALAGARAGAGVACRQVFSAAIIASA